MEVFYFHELFHECLSVVALRVAPESSPWQQELATTLTTTTTAFAAAPLCLPAGCLHASTMATHPLAGPKSSVFRGRPCFPEAQEVAEGQAAAGAPV